MANGLFALADGFRVPPDGEEQYFPPSLLSPVAEDTESLRETFAEMRAWFEVEQAPTAFRVFGHRHRQLLGFWAYWKAVFEDRHLDRLTKEMLAYAAAVTVKSAYGIPFFTHLLLRRGVHEEVLFEIMGVVRHFNGITKLADLLQLESELSDEAIRDTHAFADVRA